MANELQMLMIEFHGSAYFVEDEDGEIDFGRENKDTRQQRQAVERLNRSSIEIAREIQRELKRVLPPSINAQAQIRFEDGSVTWSGVILLIQAMGLVVDFVGFAEITKKLAEITVDRVVRRWVNEVGGQAQFDEPTQIIIVAPLAQKTSIEATSQFRMARLLIYNTIILAVLLFIQLLPFLQNIIAFLQLNKP
ncbi:MAG: hypothetical protein AABZ00_15510 [Chloroflexota bacterium]